MITFYTVLAEGHTKKRLESVQRDNDPGHKPGNRLNRLAHLPTAPQLGFFLLNITFEFCFSYSTLHLF
jgi:hypothetical protein